MSIYMIHSNINKKYEPNQGFNDTSSFTSTMMFKTRRLDFTNIQYGKSPINNTYNQTVIQVVHTSHSSLNLIFKVTREIRKTTSTQQ